MPPSLSNGGGHAVMQNHAARVVSVAFLFDDSPFAKAARAWYATIREDWLHGVLREGAVTDTLATTEQFFAAGFHQSITPLTLLEEVPAWCVWFVGSGTTTPASLFAQLKQVETARPGQFHHLLFICVRSADEVAGWLPSETGGTVVPVFLANDGGIQRGDAELAEAAVAYAYACWKRYWEAGDANLRAALALPPDSRVLTLGIGASTLDVRYYANRWSGRVAEAVRAGWQTDAGTAGPPTLRSLKELLQFLLPGWYLATEDATPLSGLGIRMADETVRLCCAGRKIHVRKNPLLHRRHFQRWLVQLKSKFAFLAFVTLPNSKRFIAERAAKLAGELWRPIGEYLKLPAEPLALLPLLRQKVQWCCAYSQALQETAVANGQPTTSFQQDYKFAWEKISAIPNPLGALARLVLMAVGLSWLVFGPLCGGGLTNPFSDPALRLVAVGAVTLLVGFPVGVVAHYYYACFVAANAIDDTEANLELRHLSETGGQAIEGIRAEGAALLRRFEHLQEAVDHLAEALAQPVTVSESVPKAATAGFLTDIGIDVLLSRRLDALSTDTYRRFQNDLSQHHQHNGVISLEGVLWRERLLQNALAVCTESISQLAFDQCVEQMTPPTAEKQTLLDNLIAETHQPALKDVPADRDAPTLCFAAPEKWREFCGQHDTMQFYNLNLRDMLIVAVIPLRKFGQP